MKTSQFKPSSVPLLVTAVLTAVTLGPASSLFLTPDTGCSVPSIGRDASAAFIQADQSSAEAGGGMLPDALPIPTAESLLLMSTAPPSGPQGWRTFGPERAGAIHSQYPGTRRHHGLLATTSAAVEPSLGRRFTLVGAKPSGTS